MNQPPRQNEEIINWLIEAHDLEPEKKSPLWLWLLWGLCLVLLLGCAGLIWWLYLGLKH